MRDNKNLEGIYKKRLLFGSLTTVHSDDKMGGSQFLSQIPECFFRGLPFHDFSFVEFGGSWSRICVDFSLIFLLDILWLEVERQVVLFAIGDSAHVKLVNWGSEKSIHANLEGDFGVVSPVHAHTVIIRLLLLCLVIFNHFVSFLLFNFLVS